MARFHGELLQRLQKGFGRTAPWIEPELRSSRGKIVVGMKHVVRRPQESAVPFLREDLPMPIVGGRRAFLGRGGAGAMLMDDHPTKLSNAIGNPKGIRDAYRQLPVDSRRGIRKLDDLARALRMGGDSIKPE